MLATLLMILMAATILDRAIDLGQLRGTDWAAGILLTACTVLLLGAGVRSRLDRYASRLAARPLSSASMPCRRAVAWRRSPVGALIVACTAPGNAAPCPTCRCLIQWT